MKLNLILFFVLAATSLSNAQVCVHTALSKKFNYKVSFIAGQKTVDGTIESKVIVQVISKTNKAVLQTLNVQTGFLYETAFQNCNNVRSLITGRNRNAEVIDNDFGDLIIADLNFDGKEDLAIKHDIGGTHGPIYEYYLQTEKNTFIKDDFLTQSMCFFPSDIDTKEKTLTTNIESDVYWYLERTYKYDTASKSWKLIKTSHVKQ